MIPKGMLVSRVESWFRGGLVDRSESSAISMRVTDIRCIRF